MARNNIHQFVAKQKAATTDQLWNEYVGEVLSMELAAKMAEPLDDLDMDEEQKQRVRETM